MSTGKIHFVYIPGLVGPSGKRKMPLFPAFPERTALLGWKENGPAGGSVQAEFFRGVSGGFQDGGLWGHPLQGVVAEIPALPAGSHHALLAAQDLVLLQDRTLGTVGTPGLHILPEQAVFFLEHNVPSFSQGLVSSIVPHLFVYFHRFLLVF